MLPIFKTLKDEHIVNIKELQKSPSRSLKGLTRILRGSDTLGYFLETNLFNDFVEDLEATTSKSYQARVKQARAQKGGTTLAQLKRRYGV